MTPKVIIILVAVILAAFSYVYQPLLAAAVILIGVSHFVP